VLGIVGEGGDEVSVARFVADQRSMHQVPHVFCCRILDLSVSWFYKWLGREPTDRQVRRGELDAAVNTAFDASGGTYGSPRIHADLLEDRSSGHPLVEAARRGPQLGVGLQRGAVELARVAACQCRAEIRR
jgi:hypothetical protein